MAPCRGRSRRLGDALLLGLVLLTAATAGARGETEGVRPDASPQVSEVIDGDTLRLADGRQIRLLGIQAPKPPLIGDNRALQAIAARARETLAELTRGQVLRLSYGGRRVDRYGRELALVSGGQGRSVQLALLRRGLARVYSLAEDGIPLEPLYEAETAARAAHRGLWALHLFRVRSPSELRADLESFQIVEGTALTIERHGGRTILALGGDGAVLGLVIDAPALKRFRAIGLAPTELIGRAIRVRGWITGRSRPTLDVTHPEQIELRADP